MSTVVKDLGAVSAYAYAVEKGYTGTEAEFAELMASYATVGQTAVNAAQTATTKASEAATSATTATNKATEATTAATTATNKAAEAQADADAAALDASQAMSAASTATTKASEAATAAATATSAKTDAVAANTAAQSAKTAAQTAQTGAETAAASVQSSAAQIQTNADDISELKEDLSDVNERFSNEISTEAQNVKKQIEISPNLIIADNCIWNEYITPTSTVSNAGVNYGHTDAIFVTKGVTYKFKTNGTYGGYRAAYRIVTNAGTYANGGQLGTADSDGFVLFTPDFSGFITVNVIKNAYQMFCEQAQYPDTYVDGKRINNTVISTIENLSELKSNISEPTVDATLVRDGGCYITDTGYISTASSSARLCAVEVVEDVKYKIVSHKGADGIVDYAFFNTSSMPQPGDTAYNSTRYSFEGDIETVTAPITGWLVFLTSVGFNDETVTPLSAIDAIARTSIEKIEEQASVWNPLIGKMIAVDGDSICYGNGYLGGYAKIIADNNNMDYQNLAVGGGTIVTGTQYNGVDRHWISTSVANLSTDADYILIEGGANDSSMSAVQLGSLTESYTATLDTSTFYGALETIFKTLTTKYVGKKYGFIIVHGILHTFMPGGDFYNAVYACAEKWGVPILDLTKYVPPFNQFRNADALNTVRTTYTTDGDGWHPTELCYREYYVPIIEAWMKTL